MIFNTSASIYSLDNINESPYPLGAEGALMHIYENECNYNAIMKSVGISELRYYQDTGSDLFVNEAGAFDSFIDKIKVFFKKVIEKIKSIFKKFSALIGQFFMKDKDFIKKFRVDIKSRDLTGFEFKGYKFEGLNDYLNGTLKNPKALADINTRLNQVKEYKDTYKMDADKYATTDDLAEKRKNETYAKVAGESGEMEESDMHEKINEKCYGEKETFAVVIDDQFNHISGAQDAIKQAKDTQDKIIKGIDDTIKVLEKLPGKLLDSADKSSEDRRAAMQNTATIRIKQINYEIEIAKAASNAYTYAFGVALKALKDRNRQAKAICVKALSYNAKKESAYFYNDYASDIFADVVIR